MQGYEPPHAPVAPPPLPASPMAAAASLLFPIVLTPYGVATVIVLLASNREPERIAMIVGLLVLVMVFNLLAMLYARRILVGFTMVVLQVLGAVLGVLPAGLAVEFIVPGCADWASSADEQAKQRRQANSDRSRMFAIGQ